MGKPDTEKAQAAYTISDELIDMKLSLDRAELIMQDINEDYFNRFDNKNAERDNSAILWEFHRNTVKSDIVSEYLYKMRVVLDSLYEQATQVGRERHEKREVVRV